MTIKPTTDCQTFDLYILGPYQGTAEMAGHRGFSGMTLPVQQARTLARDSRRRGWAAVIVPTDYRHAGLPLSEAREIAVKAFKGRKEGRAGEMFGELSEGYDEGGWWLFQADNLTAQEAGMIPGLLIIRVDKLLRRPLSLEENRWVDGLQVGTASVEE